MPLPKYILTLFARSSLRHEPLSHKVVYTAYDTAQTLKCALASVAKPLLLKGPKGLVLAVLSAAHTIDLARAAKVLKVAKLTLPNEKLIMTALKLTKKKGITPFGSLYGIPVLLEKAFARQKKGIFPVGSFTDSVRMAMKDYVKLESPTVGIFGVLKKIKKIKKINKKHVKK